MSHRATIIGNVAANLRRGQGSAGIGVPAARPAGDVGPPGEWPRDLLVERFTAELTAIAGRVHRVPDARSAVAEVRAVCRERQATRVLAWAPHAIDAPGVHEALAEDGIVVDGGWLPDGGDRAPRLQELECIPVGITGALAGIAESGTIAVISGPGRPRLASLLPPVHVAVLCADCLYPSLSAFLAAHPRIAEEGANLVLITGPSRTADIEMTLTRGVHGPGEVHVVLVDAEV